MAISSVHTLSLLSYSPIPKIPNTIKFHNQIHIHNFPLFFTHKKSRTTISLKPICTSYSNHSHFSISPKPTSKIQSFFTKNLVVVLVGSFVFMGCFCNKPVLAIDVGTQNVEKMEEKEENGGENMYGKLLEKNPRDVEASKVEKMEEKEENGEEDMFEKLLEKNPRDVEALKVVFHDRMGKGKTNEAVLYVEKLIDVEPGEVEWRLLQALCYEMMGQFSKAKRLFKDILAKRPLLLRALHGLAMVMHKNHDGPAVFEMLNKALELARREKRVTEERNIRILIAQIHVVKGDLEEGLKQFQDLVDDNPRDFRPYLCQGIIYSLLDKKNEAEEQFEIYRSLVPDEFPQRGFLDDVVLAARTSSHEQLEKEFQAEYSYKNNQSF